MRITSDLVKHSMLASLLRNRKKQKGEMVSRRKLVASEFSFVLSQFRLSFVDVVARVRLHSLALCKCGVYFSR